MTRIILPKKLSPKAKFFVEEIAPHDFSRIIATAQTTGVRV